MARLERPTRERLQLVCDRINLILGTPKEPWQYRNKTHAPSGSWVSNDGCYHIEHESDRWKLSQMQGTAGATRGVLNEPTKGALLYAMFAFIEGIEAHERAQAKAKSDVHTRNGAVSAEPPMR